MKEASVIAGWVSRVEHSRQRPQDKSFQIFNRRTKGPVYQGTERDEVKGKVSRFIRKGQVL